MPYDDLTNLQHAWFVQLFGWFDNNEHIYLAMEYIENGDLHNYIGSSGRPENEARLITKQILMGLEVMHGYGICHRDLKPQVRDCNISVI